MTGSYQTTLTPLGLDAPDREAKALLEKAQANYGMIPNMFAGMANYPALLETYMNGYGQLHVQAVSPRLSWMLCC